MTKTKSPLNQIGSRGHSLHAHVEDVIRKRIVDGAYSPGVLLPGRRALCDEFGIAPSTLEKAIKHLLDDGTLRSENRRGTFVADTVTASDNHGKMGNVALTRQAGVTNSYRIGIVDTINDLSSVRPDASWFEYMILHAVESKVSAEGSQLLYFQHPVDPYHAIEDAIEEFGRSNADAIIIIAYHDAPDLVEDAIAAARSLGIPPVVVSSSTREWTCPHVITDNRLAGRQAAEHLIGRGHREIVFIAPFDHEWQGRRVLGARDAVRAAGLNDTSLKVVRPISNDPKWSSSYDAAYDAGVTLMSRAFTEFGTIAAVISPNDWVAAGIVKVIEANTLRLGLDVSLVSFDDSVMARQCDLSSIRFPLEQLGSEAATLAMRAASGDKTYHRLRIGCSLILRGSTARESKMPTF